MRIVLSTLTMDPLGVVALAASADSSFGELRRRMNRVATLDGGAVFNDSGYSEADRSIRLVWVPTSAAQEAAVARLVQLYAQLTVASAEGLFLVAPEVYTPGAAKSTLSLLVVSRLA